MALVGLRLLILNESLFSIISHSRHLKVFFSRACDALTSNDMEKALYDFSILPKPNVGLGGAAHQLLVHHIVILITQQPRIY